MLPRPWGPHKEGKSRVPEESRSWSRTGRVRTGVVMADGAAPRGVIAVAACESFTTTPPSTGRRRCEGRAIVRITGTYTNSAWAASGLTPRSEKPLKHYGSSGVSSWKRDAQLPSQESIGEKDVLVAPTARSRKVPRTRGCQGPPGGRASVPPEGAEREVSRAEESPREELVRKSLRRRRGTLIISAWCALVTAASASLTRTKASPGE